jgi:hypothetical protein
MGGGLLRISGGNLIKSSGIDPYRTGSYNLMCSGRPLVLLPISIGNRADRGKWWAYSLREASIRGMYGTAEKARDGAPKAG